MRKGLITFAEDTTATECGSCPGLDHVIDWCGPCGVRLVDEISDSDVPGYRHARCAECIAAEAAAERMVEIAPEDAKILHMLVGDYADQWDTEGTLRQLRSTLRAHAAKVQR